MMGKSQFYLGLMNSTRGIKNTPGPFNFHFLFFLAVAASLNIKEDLSYLMVCTY